MNNEMCGCGTEEKTSSAIGLVRINYKEDFELVVELLAGEKPYQLGDEDFRIDFIVMASRYTVGRTGGVCERCAVDGNKVRCFMDAHGLPPGELRAEVKVNTPDPNYADGSRLNVAIAEGVVVLVKDNTRFDGAVVKANIPVALVDAFQLAKAHGYKGTIDEYYATFTEVGHLKENIKGTLDEMTKAEKLRVAAETERAKAENERQSNRDKFNTAEGERVKNEQQRQTNENTRQKIENERVSAESNRASAEVERAKAEQQRSSTEEARQTAESQRAKEELARVGSENERAKAEEGRTQAETQRQDAEKERKQAETERQKNRDRFNNAEEERVKNEQQRNATETERVAAEQQRNEAEVSRNKAESYRASAEGKRVLAEKERSTTFSSMQENFNSKINEANAATSDLKNVKDAAVSAANDATTATTQANEAAKQAREAAENVKDGESGIPRQALHGTTDTTFSLRPNIMEVWGVVPELNLSLAPAIDDEFVTEYLFEFTCPADKGTSLNLPAELKWYNEYVVVPEAGKTYQASIVNHVIVMGRA